MELIKITPDKKRAKSILNMVLLIEERIKNENKVKFVSLIICDYYEIIKELITAILLIDGYKTLSHKDLIDYLSENYKEFSEQEIDLIDNLRIFRNRISYEGFEIDKDYLARNENSFMQIIKKLKELVLRKIKG
ncbi:MAG: hypothetical protein Q7S33_05880 [Nanoarchaeota archaeon]|nr:hypothetical protein [Nanoarchaeota archaeon]